MIYHSLICSHISYRYCISSWGNASSTTLAPILILHKRVVRIITNNKSRSHTNPFFSALQLLKVDDVFKLEVAKVMYKIHNHSSKLCSNLFVTLSHIYSHNTRNKERKTIFYAISIYHRLKNLFAILDQKYGITYQLKSKVKSSFNSKVRWKKLCCNEKQLLCINLMILNWFYAGFWAHRFYSI